MGLLGAKVALVTGVDGGQSATLREQPRTGLSLGVSKSKPSRAKRELNTDASQPEHFHDRRA